MKKILLLAVNAMAALQPMCSVATKTPSLLIRWSKPLNTLFKINITKLTLHPEINEQLETQNITFKKHPGKRSIKCVKLPDDLQKAISNVISKESLKNLEQNTKRLVQYLDSRKQPVENDDVRIYSQEISKQFEIERGPLSDYPDEQKENEIQKRKGKIEAFLKQKLYHWKPINYNFYSGILYLVGKMAPNYAVLNQIFSEIKQRDPHFHPHTLFDFGSGVGTTVWAARMFWGESLKEYFCIDSSEDMNMISTLLLKGGKENDEPFLKGVYFKQYVPTADLLKYNVVVSAYSLLELPSVEARLQTLDVLWKKTQDYLVIIENGTIEGFKLIVEAREFISQLQKVDTNSSSNIQPFHIFAPCPHELECPRFIDGTDTPCNFEVTYFPYQLVKVVKAVKERFSYVVFKKTARSSEESEWPRIVRPVLLRHKHAVCRMCTKDGCLEDVTITAAKHGKTLYKCVRASKWGDSLPVAVEKKKDDSTNSTEAITHSL